MSVPYSTLNSLVRAMEPVLADNVLMNNPLVKYLQSHKQGRITKAIDVAVRYQTPLLYMWNGTDSLTAHTTATHTMAEYSWAHGYTAETITRNDWLVAEGNPDAVADLAKTTIQAMEDGITLGLEKELFTNYDGSSHTFMSIPEIVKATDVTGNVDLGGIDYAEQDNYSAYWWQAYVLAYVSGNGDLRWHLQKAFDTCTLVGSSPDLIVTTQAIYEKYLAEGFAKEGFLDTKVVDLGFKQAVPFAGIPMVYSPNCTSGAAYLLNSKFLYLWTHPRDFIKMSDFEETSTTNLNLISHITLTAQLITSARRAQGVITGIS